MFASMYEVSVCTGTAQGLSCLAPIIFSCDPFCFLWPCGSSFTYEVIVVDDGSTDGTSAEVERWVTQLGTDAVRLLTLEENQGKGAAVGKVRAVFVAAA